MKNTYTKLSYCILLCTMALNTQSQTLQDDIDYQFAPLNSSKITTGILLDKVLQLADISRFDGLYDTISNSEIFRQIYYELYHARYNKTGLPT